MDIQRLELGQTILPEAVEVLHSYGEPILRFDTPGVGWLELLPAVFGYFPHRFDRHRLLMGLTQSPDCNISLISVIGEGPSPMQNRAISPPLPGDLTPLIDHARQLVMASSSTSLTFDCKVLAWNDLRAHLFAKRTSQQSLQALNYAIFHDNVDIHRRLIVWAFQKSEC